MHPVYHEIRKALAGYYPDTEAAALAKMLLVEGLGFSTLELFGGKDKEVFKKDLDVLHEMLERLQNYEPVQYILGRENFCGKPRKALQYQGNRIHRHFVEKKNFCTTGF